MNEITCVDGTDSVTVEIYENQEAFWMKEPWKKSLKPVKFYAKISPICR